MISNEMLAGQESDGPLPTGRPRRGRPGVKDNNVTFQKFYFIEKRPIIIWPLTRRRLSDAQAENQKIV